MIRMSYLIKEYITVRCTYCEDFLKTRIRFIRKASIAEYKHTITSQRVTKANQHIVFVVLS